jgi:hypothetical protein
MVKTKGRTGFGDETFDSLVFNSFDMPHLHKMDFAAFMKRWPDEGHQTGTTKAGMEESMDSDAGEGDSASAVVKRHLEKKKSKVFSICELKTKARRIKANHKERRASRVIKRHRRASCVIHHLRFAHSEPRCAHT